LGLSIGGLLFADLDFCNALGRWEGETMKKITFTCLSCHQEFVVFLDSSEHIKAEDQFCACCLEIIEQAERRKAFEVIRSGLTGYQDKGAGI
jgi:hypothetical protein